MRNNVFPRSLQRPLTPSPYCGTCPISKLCNQGSSELGCPPGGPVDTSVLHPEQKDWLPSIAEVNGFELDYRAVTQDIPVLPSYLPRTRIETPRRNYMRASAIALPLRQMNQLAAKVNSSGTSAKELLGLTQSQMLVVLGFENDGYLEQVWPAKKRRPLLDAIKVVDPDVAIAWNYSVWHRHSSGWLYPRPEHLYNIKRSMKIYAELQGIGVRAIPHVYWGLRDDLERWADWLRDNPCVSTIAIDLQTADSDQDWRSIKSDISHFTRILPRRIKVLFSGVCHIDRLVHLRAIWPNLSVCNYGPLFAQHFRFKKRFGLQSPWLANSAWSNAAIFESAMRQYAYILEREHSRSELEAILRGDLAVGDSHEKLAMRFDWPDDRVNGEYLQLGFSLTQPAHTPVTTRKIA